MAVTMICIGMPVCRPAVSSVLHMLGLSIGPGGHTGRATRGSSGPAGGRGAHHHVIHHHHHPKSGGSAGCGGLNSSGIRNYSNGTWEDAVGAHDIDSWSQRRILGVGEATSGVVAGVGAGALAMPDAKRSHSSSFSKERKLSLPPSYDADDEDRDIVPGGLQAGDDGLVGFPMRTMSKVGGITVTRTVDVTNGSKE